MDNKGRLVSQINMNIDPRFSDIEEKLVHESSFEDLKRSLDSGPVPKIVIPGNNSVNDVNLIAEGRSTFNKSGNKHNMTLGQTQNTLLARS